MYKSEQIDTHTGTEEQGLDMLIDTLSREIRLRLFPDEEDGIFTATTDPVLRLNTKAQPVLSAKRKNV